MSALLLQISAVSYALVGCIGLGQIAAKLADDVRLVEIPLWISVLLHGAAIIHRALELGGLPFATLSDGLSVFGLSAAVLALALIRSRTIVQVAAGAGVLAAGLVVLAVAVSVPGSDSARLRGIWLQLHIACVFLGLSTFAVACIVSVLHLVKDSSLKNKKRLAVRGSPSRLPSLEVLDRVTLRLLKVGFPIMGVGLVCGAIHSKLSLGEFWRWNALGTLGVLVWATYGVLIQLRVSIGWRGRKAAWLTVAGFVTILIPLLVLSVLRGAPHGVG